MSAGENFVWVERFRPKNIDECILPVGIKTKLKNFIRSPQEMPNLMFSGKAGVGKTSAAKAMAAEMNADHIIINASKDGNIDTLRTTIQDFASKVSFFGGRKMVILDEGDYLNRNSTQPALRNFTEEFSKNCVFILTCNFPNNIIEPLHSRFSRIDFKISRDEQKELMKQSIVRFVEILKEVGVEYDAKAVAEHVKRYFPDLRKALNEMQVYAKIANKVDSGILASAGSAEIEELVSFLKQKKFNDMRKWVADNDSVELSEISDKLYSKATEYFGDKNIPALVMALSEYDFKNQFVTDKKINMIAMLTTIMSDCN